MLNAAVSLPILSLCVWGFSFPLLFRPVFLYRLLFSDCEGLDTVAKSREKPTKSMVQANDYYVYTHWGGRSWRELDGRARRDDVIDSHDIHEHDRSRERERVDKNEIIHSIII